MKNNPIKLLFSVILLISQTVLCKAGSFDGNETKNHRDSLCHIALNYCFGTSSVSEYDIYISKEPVTGPKHGEIVNLSDCRLVFVDMVPDANWEHPCKYIYVGKETGSKSYTCCSVDSCLPPQSTSLEPVSLTASTNRRVAKNNAVSEYGIGSMGPGVRDSALMIRDSLISAPSDGKTEYYTTNKFASHTYAVILSGGSTPALNASRYWNDCSFIYKTLRKKYGVPKKNITVLMSDGKSPAADQNKGLSFSPDLENSSFDLDGDGRPDIDYSATKDTLKMVLSELKSKLTDSDHLLVFVTDHGGKDNTNGQPYINLWNSGRIYPAEFADCFSGFNAGYISFVLGQCYSGGFIPALKANNHIVMTACGEDEESFRCNSVDKDYNEFLYNWTSYINGSDTFGNAVPSDKDSGTTNKISGKTLKKAYEYAVEKDYYNKGKTLSRIETPQLSMLSGSTAEDLALDTIPPTVYLCITDSDNKGLYRDPFIWASPYIWIRNQKDGKQNRESENPTVNEDHPYIYIYTKICNRGVKSYNGSGENIGYCWTKSSLVITIDMWKGLLNDKEGYNKDEFNGIHGNVTGTSKISSVINPGDTIISERKYYFDGDDFDEVDSKKFGMCVLAYLTTKANSCDVPLTYDGYADLTHSHRLAQNNIVLCKENETLDFDRVATLYNRNNTVCNYSIRLQSNESSVGLLSKAELNLRIPSDLVSSFNETQHETDSVSMDVNVNGKMRLLGSNSVIRQVRMQPQELIPVYLTCNFKADTDINTSEIYNLDLVVIDNRTGKEIGGQRYRIEKKQRPAINATIEKSNVITETTTLSVADCSEDVLYEWFDRNGKLVGTGSSITVPSGKDASEYTVRITAKSDGAVIYRKSEVGGRQQIDRVTASPGRVDVVLKEKSAGTMTLQLLSTTSAIPLQSCDIVPGTEKCTMPVRNFTSGVYQVALLKEGKVLDTRKFIK